jgi:iron complex outermembrane recepter protein
MSFHDRTKGVPVQKTKHSLRSILLLGAATAAAFGLANQAAAQTSSQSGSVETVVVTGSMLPRTDLTTPAPVQLISAQDIENSGITDTTDLLRSVASNGSGSLPNSFGEAFASGAANISLRGLFSNSTLVLINGERTVDYPLADDGTRSFVDLNTIPEHAIDHIEIEKDGASSVYGADAVAGVVNIITVDNYQGAEAEVQGGDSQHGGGETEYFAGRIGTGDIDTDRYNVYFDAEWEHDNAIKTGQRDYPFNQQDLFAGYNLGPIYGGGNTQGGAGATSFTPSLSATVSPVLIADFTNNYTPYYNPNPADAGQPLGPSQPIAGTCAAGGTLGTNNPLNLLYGGTYCYQNNGLMLDDQPQQDRYNLYLHVTARLWAGATGTFDTTYNESDVVNEFAPPGLQSSTPVNTSTLALPAYLTNGNANPNDPFVYGNAACPQTGQTEATAHSTTCPDAAISTILPIWSGIRTQSHVLRSTATVKGDYDGWDYTLTALAAHSWLYDNTYGFLSLPAELAAVNNGTFNFVNPAANSKALLNSLAPPISTVNTNDLELLDAHVSHELFDLPGGPAVGGFGVTVRHEQTFAPNSNPNLQQGEGYAQTIGQRAVYSAYAEISAPILTTLETNWSARYDHYSDAGDTLNPKFGAKWTPIPEFALRTTAGTGFVAPSFAQSSSNSETQGFQSPFQINSVSATGTCAFVVAHGGSCPGGVPTGGDPYVNSPYSLGSETAGNPNVKPQHSISYTAGAVIQPFDDIDLSATIDYYWIQERGIIWSPSTNAAVADYLNGQPLPPGVTMQFDGPDPLYPTAPLRPINIIGEYQNQNKINTDGVDLEIKGSTDLPFNVHWTSDLSVTNIFDFNTWWNGQPKTNWVGTMAPTDVNSGMGTAKYQGTWSNTFSYDALSTTFTVYYHSGLYQSIADVGYNFCLAPYLPVAVGGASCRSAAFTDVDWTVRYDLTDSIQLDGTIRNLLDASPPLNPLGGGPTMNNGAIDQMGLVGRFFEFGIKLKT